MGPDLNAAQKGVTGADWGKGGEGAAKAVDDSAGAKGVNEAVKATTGDSWGKGGENVIPMKKEMDKVGDALGKLF